MTNFARRRTIGVTFVAVSAFVLWLLTFLMRTALLRPEGWLGWGLLVAILFLAGYSLRKKLSMLPLGASASWLQIHIYVGLLTLPLFLLHTGGVFPSGLIEVPLGFLYVTVFMSGVVGLGLTRHIPPRLTGCQEEVIYERIPEYVRRLREKAEACVLTAAEDSSSDVVGQLYVDTLHTFFERPRNFVRHVIHSRAPRNKLLRSLEDTRRFLNTDEQAAIEELAELVHRKDDLDYQFAMQSLLKFWLIVHVPLTWALLVFTGFHVFVARVYTQSSGSGVAG